MFFYDILEVAMYTVVLLFILAVPMAGLVVLGMLLDALRARRTKGALPRMPV